MPIVQQWGRRESIIWPPRGYLYTLGAFFLACVAMGFFVYAESTGPGAGNKLLKSAPQRLADKSAPPTVRLIGKIGNGCASISLKIKWMA